MDKIIKSLSKVDKCSLSLKINYESWFEIEIFPEHFV